MRTRPAAQTVMRSYFFWPMGRLQTDHIRDMLVSGRFLFMRALPPLQIPNFKTPAATHERHFAFQSNFLAKLLRQNETTLSIRRAVLRARMQLAQKNATIARGDVCVRFRR